MYFVLGRSSKPGRWIGDSPVINGINWWSGVVINTPIPDPLIFSLEPLNPDSSDDAPYLPAYLKAGKFSLFREDLIETMRECGVNNIDYYNVLLTDPDNGQSFTNYKAANIIGLIAAADMELSEATVHPGGPPLIDVDFDHLVVDETKTRGALLFRLAESTNAILIHKKLRDCLLGRDFGEDLTFYDPREIAL